MQPILSRNQPPLSRCEAGNRARNNISPFLHLRWQYFSRWGDTSFLLGGRSGERKDGDLAKWKPNLEMIKVCVNYVTATGRLESEQELMEPKQTTRRAVSTVRQNTNLTYNHP